MARPKEFDEGEVLRKAMLVFWSKGFEGTTLPDLLTATGLSKSSLYETFGDKRSLFLRALETYREDRLATLGEALAKGDSGYGAIEAFLLGVLEHSDEVQDRYGCMSCNEAVELAPRDDEVRRLVAADFQGVEDAFARAIRRGRTDGSIPDGRPVRELARFLTVSLQGVHVMSRAGTSSEQLLDTVKVMLSALVHDEKRVGEAMAVAG